MNKEQREVSVGGSYTVVKYNGEAEFTCICCGELKSEKEFRKRKGGYVSTSCRSCVNKKYERDPVKAHFNAIKCRALKEGIPFNITLEDLEIPDVCPVLGINLTGWGENGKGGYKDNSPSIDKFIPFLGYIKGNVTIISFKANLLKRDGTLEEIGKLYEWMKHTTEEMENSSLSN